ncbi:hypothetical protein FJY63_07870, partial [Candidatus Sumerlaeota bacterium]|nr:hypothetical protein [Candidatus Sumerlaeota bacterium]
MTIALPLATVGSMNGLANSPDPSPWPLKAVAIAVICAAAFSYTFVPVRACNDVWWHLKTGQLIVERGLSLPRNDEFTFTGENIAWHNHEWLSQVVLYRLFQWGGGRASDLIGLRSVIGVVSVLSVLTFLLVLALVQLRCKCLPIAALITLLALDVSRLNLYPRPPAVSYLFTAFFLLLLCQWKSGRRHARTLLVLPPLTAIWANLHGGFVVGLILVACYLIGEIARHFLVRKRSGANALTHVDADLSEAAILSDEHEPVADHKGAFKSRLLWLSAL